MIVAHIYLDDNLIARPLLDHCYRTGDTVRVREDKPYAKVMEVIWCLDEHSPHGQRVNIRLESENPFED